MNQPRADSTITPPPPTTAYRPVRAGGGAETVINPERRGVSLPPSEGSGLPNSSVWHRLFPSEYNYQEPDGIPSPSGMLLGHFQIEERIGAGGMGAVFRALDTRLQRAVALKILTPSLSRDDAAVQRFRNEARAAARLDHDNVARVYFIGEEQGLHFIAFEFITGNNLRNLIRERGRIGPTEAVNYTLQIASAVRHTSSHGVVHRDIKPSNIIITPSGRAKLVDLGLARKESSESAVDLTLAGTTLGTFDYISPEQAKDPRNVDVRSDIYSLGCTLYHMLTGEPPYPDGTVMKKLLDHQSGEPPDPAKKNRRVSAELSLIVRRMMASDPKLRYQTPDHLTHDLMLVAGTLGLRGISPEGLIWLSSRQSMSAAWRQNAGVLAMVALLVFIVIGLNQYPKLGNNWSGNSASRNLAARTETVSSENQQAQMPDAQRADLREIKQNQNASSQTGSLISENGSSLSDTALAKKTKERKNSKSGDGIPLDDHAQQLTAKTGQGTIPPLQLFPDASENSFLLDPKISPRSALLNRADSPISVSSETSLKITDPDVIPDANNGSTKETVRDTTASVAQKTAAATEESGVFVLASDGSPAKRFPTLEAACAAVADGSAIELRFNGHRTEKPFRLSKKNLTIRAAKGFRPIIDFSPTNSTSDTHLRLISVSSGPVLINNVAFEINVPPFLAIDRISLFSVDRSEELKLHGVGMTLNNPGQRPAALFDLSIEPGQMLADMKMNSTGMARDPLKIELTECLVRGNGDLFHVRHTKPGRLTLRDTAIALDGTLLKVEGHSEKPAEQTRLELGLEHVTAVLGQSLIRLDSGDLPRELPPVAVNANNNVLSISGSSGLIATSGNTSYADFRKLFLWKGEKNFYDRCKIFWSFTSGSESLGFDEWKSNGANNDVGASNEKLVWVAGRAEMSQVTPESFTLDRQSDEPNAAVGAATDGNDAGADASKLPRLTGPEARSE